jgi:hypothetical protein
MTKKQGDTGGYTPTQTTPASTPLALLQQAIETGYYVGSEAREERHGLIPADQLYTANQVDDGVGDTLLEFLLRELVFDTEDRDDPASQWEEAQRRMERIMSQLQTTQRFLDRYDPSLV